jgi:hypothetical protein
VFGELYGSAVETRIARDFMEVSVWLKGGDEPSTVTETLFRADRLMSSHLIDPKLLRADSFDEFMVVRQKRLLALIEQATGKTAYIGDVAEEGDDVEGEEDGASMESEAASS